MSRETHVRFCEELWGKFLGLTRLDAVGWFAVGSVLKGKVSQRMPGERRSVVVGLEAEVTEIRWLFQTIDVTEYVGA